MHRSSGFRGFLGLVVGLVITGLVSGCYSNSETPPESSSATLDAGRAYFARTKALQVELTQRGFDLEKPDISHYSINGKPEDELLEVRDLLNSFLINAEAAIKFPNNLNNKNKIENQNSDLSIEDITLWIKGANQLEAQVETELKRIDRGPISSVAKGLSSDLWQNLKVCQSWTKKNMTRFGLLLRRDLYTVTVEKDRPTYLQDLSPDGGKLLPFLARLGRQKRLQLKRTISLHLTCLNAELQYTQIVSPSDTSRSHELDETSQSLQDILTRLADL